MGTIKAIVDGTEYSPVESIFTGGKTVDLEAELDLENKAVTITENGDTEITPSTGKDGIASVTVHTNVQGAGGIGAYAYITTAAQIFASAIFPNVVEVEFPPQIKNLGGSTTGVFANCDVVDKTAPSKITIRSTAQITNLNNLFSNPQSKHGFDEIEFDFDTSHVTNWGGALYHTNARKLIGALNLSSATSVGSLFSYSSFKELEFVPNTIPLSIDFSSTGTLTKDSLISIANGLAEGVVGGEVKHKSAAKTTMSTIIGTVAMDSTNTFHIFTADASGTVTLTDFITNIKGWTIT